MKSIIRSIAAVALCTFAMISCTQKAETVTTLSGLNPADFEDTVNGKTTALYTLTNEAGMEVCITNFGARIVSIMVPDKDGNMKDVVLGFDNIKDYENVPSDFGASIGRYANRINQGKITIDGETIQLPQNNYGHCLHGGPNGWQYAIFEAAQEGNVIKLTHVSPDGDANFPGTVTASVTYTLTEDNAIEIAYEATTDKKTVINMTNHSYFNLSGDPTISAVDHIMYINSDCITPVDSTFMTTGEMTAVEGTPFDFNTPKAIAQDINADDIQLVYGKGYDHNWVLNTQGSMNEVAAKITSPITGIYMEVYTDEPGVQCYTGNFLDGTVTGKKGIVYQQRASVCLETQHYPDTPNKPEWPSAFLEPGQTYQSHCTFKFGVEK